MLRAPCPKVSTAMAWWAGSILKMTIQQGGSIHSKDGLTIHSACPILLVGRRSDCRNSTSAVPLVGIWQHSSKSHIMSWGTKLLLEMKKKHAENSLQSNCNKNWIRHAAVRNKKSHCYS